jgi:polyisoprenyl-phosphate glycosyltransferase
LKDFLYLQKLKNLYISKLNISIVIPAFNEAENLPVLLEKLTEVMTPYPSYELLFVDDGSKDGTYPMLKHLASQNLHVRFLSFSRNFGHQMALRAGLEHAKGDCVISMDADMQHPPELLPELIARWQEGYDIVYTVREPDPTLGFVKKVTSKGFYRLLRYMADIDLDEGAADFRLLDRKVVDYLKQFKEADLFLRGIISWIGFKQFAINYKPAERFAGKTKYSMKKMLLLASAGITSFSTKPLYLSVLLGFFMLLFSIGFALVSFYDYLMGNVVTGWTSTVIFISLIGGIQLVMMGIIGIYLAKMFYEVKGRPTYILQDFKE